MLTILHCIQAIQISYSHSINISIEMILFHPLFPDVHSTLTLEQYLPSYNPRANSTDFCQLQYSKDFQSTRPVERICYRYWSSYNAHARSMQTHHSQTLATRNYMVIPLCVRVEQLIHIRIANSILILRICTSHFYSKIRALHKLPTIQSICMLIRVPKMWIRIWNKLDSLFESDCVSVSLWNTFARHERLRGYE